MTATGGGARVDLARVIVEGRRLLRRAWLLAVAMAVGSGMVVAGLGFGAREVVHSGGAGLQVAVTEGDRSTNGTNDQELRRVPPVVDKNEADAIAILEEHEFEVEIDDSAIDHAESADERIVKGQDPEAEDEVPRGTTVTLVITEEPAEDSGTVPPDDSDRVPPADPDTVPPEEELP
jgi:hypothetical protein